MARDGPTGARWRGQSSSSRRDSRSTAGYRYADCRPPRPNSSPATAAVPAPAYGRPSGRDCGDLRQADRYFAQVRRHAGDNPDSAAVVTAPMQRPTNSDYAAVCTHTPNPHHIHWHTTDNRHGERSLMAPHARNAALAARVAELGLTEQKVADLLNDVKEQATGKRGKCTDRYVRMLLDGEIRWPLLVNRQALEQVLGKPILDLGFIPHGNYSRVRQGPSDPLPDDPSEDGRRASSMCPDDSAGQHPPRQGEVLAIGVPPIHITVPAVPRRGRIGRSDVDRLRAPLAELIRIDQRLGSAGLAPACARLAEQVQETIRVGTATEQIGHALYTLAGEYLATAGWSHLDAMELGRASTYLDRALQTAHTACDPMPYAKVTNLMVLRFRAAGDHAHAHFVAGCGLNSRAARINPRVRALFNARRAYGLAVRGEVFSTERELGRARRALARVTPNTPTPAWLTFFTAAELAALSAAAYHELGRYRQAVEQATIAARNVLPGYQRNKTLYTLGLAAALLSEREVEQAADQATIGLDLASRLHNGLHHGRVAHRLRHLRDRFSQWPEVPEARQWVADYDRIMAHTSPACPNIPTNNT